MSEPRPCTHRSLQPCILREVAEALHVWANALEAHEIFTVVHLLYRQRVSRVWPS